MTEMEEQPILQTIDARGLSFEQCVAKIREHSHELKGWKPVEPPKEMKKAWWREACARAAFESQESLKSSWKWMTSSKFREGLILNHYDAMVGFYYVQQANAHLARP